MARKKKPLPPLDVLLPKQKLARIASLTLLAALTVLLSVWYLLVTDLHGARPWVILGIHLVPLALVAPGMILGQPRAHAWACYILNIYFIQGVITAFEPGRMTYGILEAVTSALLFTSCMMYTRWTFQVQRKQAGE